MFCYFHISIAGSEPQTVVFELYNDKCPKTCQNFIALCQAPGKAKRGGSVATYRGTLFHRIIPQFMIQGGDFTSFDGKGGHAHPSTNDGKPTFNDECFDISHDQAGILSMANKGKNTNGSQFFITLGKALHLNGKHCAFGKVVRGVGVVHEIAKVETEGDRPVAMQRVVIIDCGVGTGNNKDGSGGSASDSSSNSSSSTSSSRNDRKRKHKSSKSKKRRHKRDRDDDSSHKKSKKRRSSHSKHSSKRHKRDEYKRKKKDKRSHRHRRERSSSSSSSSDDDHGRHSSKKKRKHDR